MCQIGFGKPRRRILKQCILRSGAQDMCLLYTSDNSGIFLHSHPSQNHCRHPMFIVVSRGVAELVIAVT